MSLRIYGNRTIKTLPGQDTRPTASRVRQALFNVWQGNIAGCRWLDLCAGSGAMGAEALCRGAAEAVAIELSPLACRIIRENWERVSQPDQKFHVIRGNVLQQMDRLRNQPFDRIYVDPPYDSELYMPVLTGIVRFGLLTPMGEVAVEHNPDIWQAIEVPGLNLIREKRYGTTQLTFYTPETVSA
ncbi:MAG: 16S rRNA (guanine(966)-N(2))-methyltransferase RsmD [Cyanobacteria bacterium Co-bin8]|nr:16S rRNA (guanine(966)-N(2))-methyltransferase RsmD [Cyanobacteria bacterium Co-bin8]